jgi:hypothetical protein
MLKRTTTREVFAEVPDLHLELARRSLAVCSLPVTPQSRRVVLPRGQGGLRRNEVLDGVATNRGELETFASAQLGGPGAWAACPEAHRA